MDAVARADGELVSHFGYWESLIVQFKKIGMDILDLKLLGHTYFEALEGQLNEGRSTLQKLAHFIGLARKKNSQRRSYKL